MATSLNADNYEEIGIPEYWIVDPQLNQVVVLAMTEEHKTENVSEEVGVFQGQQTVVSTIFPALALTARQILNIKS